MRRLIILLILLSPSIAHAQVANQLVTLSANGKYFVNSITGKPVFLTGEDGFLADLQISSTDLTTYLTDRSARGFNAIWVGFTDQIDQSTPPKDFLGNLPFSSGGVSPNNWFGTLNSAYWTRLDALVAQASSLGITVFIHPSFIGNCCADGDSAAWLAASAGIIQNYGIAVGTRYASANNVVYVLGGDYDSTNATIRTNLATFAAGLRSADPNHLITLEACRAGSCAFPNSQDTTQSYGGAGSVPSYIGMNWAYAVQSSVVASCNAAFTNSTGHSFPPVMGEDWYELEHSLTGTATRIEGYQEILSGCYTGRLFGNGPIWSFNSPNGGSTTPTWQSQLASAGSVGQQYMGQLFRSREHWLLTPDVSHTYLTAGFGSGLTLSVLSRTSDGQTMIAYVPNGNATTISVNMAGITSASSTVNEWWYNPQTSATTHIGTHANSGTVTFTPPDANDWVLVLDDNSANLPAPGVTAGTYTAASCNQSDVTKVINGPTHTAIDGDTILIPAGTCTWTAGISISNIGISIIGAGTQNTLPNQQGAGTITTTINDNVVNSALISMSPIYGNSLSRISSLNLTTTVTTLGSNPVAPLAINGTCSTSGCPNLRLDNLTFPTNPWATLSPQLPDAAVVTVSNVFGVADHSTIGDVAPTTAYLLFINVGHGSWLASPSTSQWGDLSWASADSFGTAQTFYLENNVFNYSLGTDTDISGSNGGGARFACRFNTFNNVNFIGVCSGHGTETTGRPRGVRQWEGYDNTGACTYPWGSQGCGSAWPGRSGVGMSFGNSFTSGSGAAQFKGLDPQGAQRIWRNTTVWQMCAGKAPWDTNDGVTYYSGTVGSVAGANNNYTVTDSGSPAWTTSPQQWGTSNPAVYGAPYSFWDVTQSFGFPIASNTANSLTSFLSCQGGSSCTQAPANGDSYQILRASACIDQPNRGAGVLLSGNPPNQTAVNQVRDPTYQAGDGLASPSTPIVNIGSTQGQLINSRDIYVESVNQIAQTSATFPFNGTVDAEAVSSYVCSGATCNVNVPSTTNFAVNGYVIISGTVKVACGGQLCNVDGSWKISAKTGGQITVPNGQGFGISAGAGGFAVTVGSGHGTLANRPTTCTPNVGYWATDQGSWNTGGVNGPQGYPDGELFTCTATNTWTLSYVPFAWPHPLVTGTGTVSVSPTSENFGSIVVGGASSPQAATLTNGTGASITITSVTYTGNTADFPQTANTCSGTIAANGGTCAVTNQFTPTSTGARSATLTIATSAGSFPVALSGTGTSATNPGVNINPASIAFGNVTVGFPTPGTTVTITSTTSANLVMGNPPAIISGAGFSLQAIGGQCTANQSIPMNSTCVESVVFNPSATGPASGQLSIFDNVTGSPQIVTLTGTGVGNISLNPASMNFGLIAQGQTSGAQLLTVTNNTGVTLTLTGVSFTNLDFAATSNTCNSGMLTSGMSCTMNITFRPSATTGTNETGMVQISYTGVGMSPVVIDLAGTVLPPIGTPATNIFAKNLAACGGIPKLTTFCMTQDGHIYVGVCNPTCTAFKPMAFTVTGVAQ